MLQRTMVGGVMATMLMLGSAYRSPVWAQTESPADPDVAGIAASVNHRRVIRVLLASGQQIEIQTPALRESRLEGVEVSSGERIQYPVGEIRRIWGRGSAAGTGFLVGFALGGVGGAIGGAALANMCIFGSCPSPSFGQQAGAALAGGFMGGMAVGLAGLVIGAPIQKWTPVYRAEEAAVRPVITSTAIGLAVEF